MICPHHQRCVAAVGAAGGAAPGAGAALRGSFGAIAPQRARRLARPPAPSRLTQKKKKTKANGCMRCQSSSAHATKWCICLLQAAGAVFVGTQLLQLQLYDLEQRLRAAGHALAGRGRRLQLGLGRTSDELRFHLVPTRSPPKPTASRCSPRALVSATAAAMPSLAATAVSSTLAAKPAQACWAVAVMRSALSWREA